MRVLHESRLILYADHVTSWPVTVCVLGEIGRCRRDNTLKFDLGRQLSCVTAADVRLCDLTVSMRADHLQVLQQ